MVTNFNGLTDFKQQFKNAMIQSGITPPIELFDDGQIHRFPTNDDLSNADGWYALHSDGIPVGVFGCWRQGCQTTWRAEINRQLTVQELDEHKLKIAAMVQKRDLERQKIALEAEDKANDIWSNSNAAADEHPYLKLKGIKPYIARVYEQDLVVPIYLDEKITSLQFINSVGSKKFLQGGRISGGSCLIGNIDEESPIFICEGYATGASIHEATGKPVAITFNARNLTKVAKKLRDLYPNHPLIVAGDDDWKTMNNPGKKSATEAAIAVSAKLVFPSFREPRQDKWTDFNDMVQDQGLFITGITLDDAIMSEPLGLKKFSLKQFSLNGQSEVMKEQMLADVFVLGRMAILGQFVVFYAAPNVGKTLLVIWMVIQGIKNGDIDGSDIFYVNADDNHKGLVFKIALAEKYGFHMLAPGYANFKSADFLTYIKKMIDDGNPRGKVVILDTLKKFVDIMRKDKSSDFGVVMRSFVSHGGTVIGLGHVNKHKNSDGKSVYGGTSDITDDADCYYMIEELQTTATTKTIRFENRKSRGDVDKTATFTYTNEKVSNYQELLDSVRTMSENEADALAQINAINNRLDANKEVIDVAVEAIASGVVKRTELVHMIAQTTCFGRSKVLKILEQHTGPNYSKGHRWTCTKGDKNVHTYALTTVDLEDSYRGSM